MYYKLDDKIPIRCNNIEWSNLFERSNRIVAKTKKNDIVVSTVFLGIDHQYNNGPPILFETLIFGGEYNEDQWRYSTWEEAEQGHEIACQLCGISDKSSIKYAIL